MAEKHDELIDRLRTIKRKVSPMPGMGGDVEDRLANVEEAISDLVSIMVEAVEEERDHG
jgi:hypothetical protein